MREISGLVPGGYDDAHARHYCESFGNRPIRELGAGRGRIYGVRLQRERTIPRKVLYVRKFHLYRNLTRTHAPIQIS